MLVCVTKSLLSIHRDINNFLDCEIHAYKFSRNTAFMFERCSNDDSVSKNEN